MTRLLGAEVVDPGSEIADVGRDDLEGVGQDPRGVAQNWYLVTLGSSCQPRSP